MLESTGICSQRKENTGQTTLTETLVREFSVRGLKVAVIKHDGHDFVPGCTEQTVTVTKRRGGNDSLF